MPFLPPAGGGSGGGSGDGTDPIARARANSAYSLASQNKSDLQSHETSDTPHPAYDNIPDLTLIFQNGLI